jgi:hypothetical protein
MIAILELIKTLIPFGIAFLILWGIGRLCCTSSAKQPNEDQAKKKKKHPKQKKPNNDPNQGSTKKESLMDNKTDFFTSKKPMISKSDREHHELNQILPLSTSKHKKLTPIQKAFLFKEILDSPKAIKPYKRKYPR